MAGERVTTTIGESECKQEVELTVLDKPSIFYDRVLEVVNGLNGYGGRRRAENGRVLANWVREQWKIVDDNIVPQDFQTVYAFGKPEKVRRFESDSISVVEHFNSGVDEDSEDFIEVCDKEKHGFHHGRTLTFRVSHDDRSKLLGVEYVENVGSMNSIESKGTSHRRAGIDFFNRGKFALTYGDSISGRFSFPKEFD